jgi:hypothetical protein
MKIKCKYCSSEVVEGEILIRENSKGIKRKKFDIYYKPLGTILKNKSNNSEDWKGICSKCMSKKIKKEELK